VVHNVLIKGCYLAVNDDAIALKGGRVHGQIKTLIMVKIQISLLNDSEFGFCHSALTNGSESIHNKNVIMRIGKVKDAIRLLWLKIRPDTPQHYVYITIENITGQARSFIFVKPCTQFFDLKGRKEVPLSFSDHISMKNIDLEYNVFFIVAITEYDRLSDFNFENLKIKTEKDVSDPSIVKGFIVKNVEVNEIKMD